MIYILAEREERESNAISQDVPVLSQIVVDNHKMLNSLRTHYGLTTVILSINM